MGGRAWPEAMVGLREREGALNDMDRVRQMEDELRQMEDELQRLRERGTLNAMEMAKLRQMEDTLQRLRDELAVRARDVSVAVDGLVRRYMAQHHQERSYSRALETVLSVNPRLRAVYAEWQAACSELNGQRRR